MTERLTIILVDDHPAMRRGIHSSLEDRFDVVAEAEAPDEAIKKILAFRPDIALIDVQYGAHNMGASIVSAVKKAEPDITCVAFTALTSREDVASMFDAGVDGYLTKSTRDEDLADLLNDAVDGTNPISAEVAGFMLAIEHEVERETPHHGLTPKEREVVKMIARGYTYRESATRLGMKVKTFETHMSHIFQKLEVASRHALALWAWQKDGLMGRTNGGGSE
jgi:DNA-binding NarL/FixJ family response regulator